MDLDDLRDAPDSKGPKPEIARFRPISADSHICEPPDLFINHIEPKFRDRAPHTVMTEKGVTYMLEGVPRGIGLAGVAAAGRDPKDLHAKDAEFQDLQRGGWDPRARLEAQDVDGVIAEVIFPTVGMTLSHMPDPELMNACVWAYNRWLADFCSVAPDRLFGLGELAILNVDAAIADLRRFKDMGFKGVYMPGYSHLEEDYDDEVFDPLWAACVEMDMPICFHTFGSRKPGTNTWSRVRGKQQINAWHSVIRDNQDIIGMFIFGAVFDRFPDLKLVCVEADAGWAPHYMYRMDHMYLRHRYWQKAPPLKELPSHYFRENVWLTFQDDLTAFRTIEMMNPKRLMWANDYPHGDATWPWSHALLREQTRGLSDTDLQAVLHQNVKDLFDLSVN